MPVLAPVVAAIGAWVATFSAATWISIGIFVASTAYALLSRPDSPGTSDKDIRGDPGLRMNTRDTQEPIKVVYGLHRVGGNDVFFATSGTNNNYLWIVQTLSEGACDSIYQIGGADQVWLGDKLESAFGTNVNYYFYQGTSGQNVDANLAADVPDWTDCLRNTCYIVWKLEWNSDLFQGVPARTVDLKGRQLYDFRTATTAWSDNAVLALYDYMTNTRYGCGIAAAKIDTTSWTACANYWDSKGWSFNMAINRQQAAIDVVNAICSHFRGALVWYDGKYYLRYADLNDESSLMTLDDEHIVQDERGKASVSISEPSRFDEPEAVRVKFIDSTKNYVADDIVIGDSDGVTKELQLLGFTDRETASNIALYNLERWQLNRTISGTFRGDALQLEPHDVVTFNSTALSIADQLMRVQTANILPTGEIELSLAYEATELYNDDYDLLEENVYTCTLPEPNDEPPPVRNATLTEETYNYRLRTFTRLKVAFDPPENYLWFDYVEAWLSYDDTNWEHMFNATSDFEFSTVEEGKTYYIRLKTVNIWGVKQQDANDRKLSTLITGYVTAPDSIDALYAVITQNAVNLYADKLSDTDIELYEFRLGTGWSGGIFMAALRAPNLSLAGVKPGNHTFLCNTLSNNGIYGTTARSVSTSLKDPPDGWTVDAGLTQTCSYDTDIIEDETGANWDQPYHALSFAAGQSFIRVEGVDLSGYANFDHDIDLYDSAGKRASGIIGDVGAGETLGSDLATNGNFETYTGTQDDGVDDAFDGWTVWNFGVPYGNYVDATADAHGGSSAVKLHIGAYVFASIWKQFNVTSGKLYKITGYSKGTGTLEALFSVYDVTNDEWPVYEQGTGNATTSYAQFTYYVNAPIGCSALQLHLCYADPLSWPNTVYWDDVTFQEVTECASDGVLILPSETGTPQNSMQAEQGRVTITAPEAMLRYGQARLDATVAQVTITGYETHYVSAADQFGWKSMEAAFNVNDSSYTFNVKDGSLLSGQTFTNMEQYTYSGDSYIRCRHDGGVLTGTFTTEIYDIGASDRYLVYVLCDVVVIGGGTTWDDLAPPPTTWDQMGNLSWDAIFSLDAGPKVEISMLYGDTSPPTNRVEKLEILSAIVTGRYFQVEITITDPTPEVHAMVEEFTLKFCQ